MFGSRTLTYRLFNQLPEKKDCAIDVHEVEDLVVDLILDDRLHEGRGQGGRDEEAYGAVGQGVSSVAHSRPLRSTSEQS